MGQPGRPPSSEPKGVSIRVRLSEEMRDWIDRECAKKQMSMSDLIRDMISAKM